MTIGNIAGIHENVLIKLKNGSSTKIKNIKKGDMLYSPTGEDICVVNNKRFINHLSYTIPMVQLINGLVTYSQKIKHNGNWTTAGELPDNVIRKKINFFCKSIHNLETIPEHSTVIIDGFECQL